MKDDNEYVSDKVIQLQPFMDDRDYPYMNSYQIQFNKNAKMIDKGRPYRFLLLSTFVDTVTLEQAKKRMSTLVESLHDQIFERVSAPDEDLVRGVAIIDIRHGADGLFEVWLALKDYPELPRDDDEAMGQILQTLVDAYACPHSLEILDREAPLPVEIRTFSDLESDERLIQKLTSDGGAENCVFQVRLNGLT